MAHVTLGSGRKASTASIIRSCMRELARDNITPERRELIKRQLGFYRTKAKREWRTWSEPACRWCGGVNRKPSSIACWQESGMGPGCRTELARQGAA